MKKRELTGEEAFDRAVKFSERYVAKGLTSSSPNRTWSESSRRAWARTRECTAIDTAPECPSAAIPWRIARRSAHARGITDIERDGFCI